MEFLDIITIAGMGLLVGIGWILNADIRTPGSPGTGEEASRRAHRRTYCEVPGPVLR